MSPIRPPANPAAGATATRPKFGPPATGAPKPPAAPMPSGFGGPPAASRPPATPPPTQPPPVQQAQLFAPPPMQTQQQQQQGVDIFDVPDPEFNPAAEAAESVAPPPPDDGDHYVEITMNERNPDIREISWNQDTKDGPQQRGAVALSLLAVLNGQGDPFNGRRVYFDVTSFGKKAVGVEGNTNDVALILKALGETPTGRPKTDAYRVKELLPATILMETQWHANFPYDKDNPKKNRRPYKVGQENFPKDEVTGAPQPLYETPSGEPLRTIAVPIGFKRMVQ